MDVIRSAGASGAVCAGDQFGKLTFLDPRMQSPIARVQVHKASNGKASRKAWGRLGRSCSG